MKRRIRGPGAIPAPVGLLLLAALLLLPAARADEPLLAIRMAGGESAIYAVGEIARIGFEGGATLVVVTTGGAASYATESIVRIEFLWEFSGVAEPEQAAALIKATHLFQNQPNPFSPETRIGFELPRAGEVELRIYSVDGRLVRGLVKDTRQAGRHTVSWDGLDDAGRRLPSGIYFYSLRSPGIEESRRMILLP
jgi:hypothetical protein